MLLRILVIVLLLVTPVSAKQPKPEDFPLTFTVASVEYGKAHSVRKAPTDVQCYPVLTSTGTWTHCEDFGSQIFDSSIDTSSIKVTVGEKMYTLECLGRLEPGTYKARKRRSDGFEFLVPDETGKLQIWYFRVTAITSKKAS
jgi:hypothetical protein